jgi:hypothetical protein
MGVRRVHGDPLVRIAATDRLYGDPIFNRGLLVGLLLLKGGITGMIQSLSQASLPVLSAWVEVGGIAPSLWLKALPLQRIST